MLKRRRCHPLYIVEQLFARLIPIALCAVYMFTGIFFEEGFDGGEFNGIGILIAILAAVGVIALVALSVWISWLNKWISAEDNTLIYESGVFIKKRVTIPFSKINTIDMGRNLFQRIFGTCRLKVDTGAIENGAESNAEMNIVFSLSDAEEFRSYILGHSAGDESKLREAGATAISEISEPRWAVRARFSDFMLYGLTQSSVWKLFCSIIVVVCFVAEISSALLVEIGEALLPYAQSALAALMSNGLILLIIYIALMVVTVAVVANLISIAYAAIRFYGFRVAREGDNIVVRYGLLTLKNYTVQAKNIHALVVKQNFFQQIIGRCSVEMISIGYGNEKEETNLLFPIIQMKKLPWLVETLLPEYSLSAESHKPGKRSIRFIIIRPIFWTTLFLAAGLVFCSFIMESMSVFYVAAAVILLSVVVNSVLRYRKNAIGCDGKVMLVRSGGTRVSTHLIRVDAVQSIGMVSGIFQRRHGVAGYRVDFHAPMIRSVAAVNHMDDNILHELDKYILK